MARKKKRWRDGDDPAEIFGGERLDGGDSHAVDPAYDAFRRHIEEHIQGETRAFHELRSTAEHELEAARIVTSPPRPLAAPKRTVAMEAPKPLPHAASAVMQAAPRPPAKTSSIGTTVMLGLVFTTLGFLSHSAYQQMQPANRKPSKGKLAAEANCVSDKAPAPKKANNLPPKTTVAAAPPPAPAPLEAAVPVPAAPPPSPALETDVPEPLLKAMTLRPAELRKGPGSNFEIVDSLPPGFALEGLLTTDRQWLRVKPGAFVSADAIQFQDPAAAGYQSYWVGQNVANIREFPLISSKVLRKAEPGAELKLQIFNAEWAQVSGGGFVFRKLVTQEAPKVLQLPAVMRVTVEKAEIRGGPGQQYPVLGLYFRNHKVEVQEMEGAWLRVGPDQYIRAQEMELSVKSSSDKTM